MNYHTLIQDILMTVMTILYIVVIVALIALVFQHRFSRSVPPSQLPGMTNPPPPPNRPPRPEWDEPKSKL
jgi:hypothetical protein